MAKWRCWQYVVLWVPLNDGDDDTIDNGGFLFLLPCLILPIHGLHNARFTIVFNALSSLMIYILLNFIIIIFFSLIYFFVFPFVLLLLFLLALRRLKAARTIVGTFTAIGIWSLGVDEVTLFTAFWWRHSRAAGGEKVESFRKSI